MHRERYLHRGAGPGACPAVCVLNTSYACGWWVTATVAARPPCVFLPQGLYSVNFTQPPYSVEYPSIVNLLQNRPCVPVNVTIQDNCYSGLSGAFLSATAADMASWSDPAPTGNAAC